MLEKLRKIKERFDFLTEEIVKPEIISDNKEWKKLVKERSAIEEIAALFDELESATNEKKSAEVGLASESDSEMIALYKEEITALNEKIEKLNEDAKILLLPKDEHDDKNVIIEIRAGAGGDEAGIFGKELMDMYIRYAERRRWKVEMIDLNDTEVGGIKDATFMISGKGAYSYLKFESGVHRVQRVPETESQGRVHTSTATVAVLPELEEVEFEIEDKDVRIDTYRSSGAGGQHVNKTESAIRLTHIPTGIVVACQDERSQLKNKEKAFSVLKSKLYDYYQGQKEKEYANTRKIQVGTGDRSEKIRTYNFPQSRVTDHRINFTTHDLIAFMDGDLTQMIDELIIADRKLKLEQA